MKSKPDFSFASDLPRPKGKTLADFRDWIRGPFKERMMNDPVFRRKAMYACGYRKRRDGSVYVIPQ